MVIVILAEKEKQAEAYATALGQFSKKKGVYVIRQPLYFPAEKEFLHPSMLVQIDR